MHNPNQQTINLSGSEKYICRACRGAGKVIDNLAVGDSKPVQSSPHQQIPCMACNGTGFHRHYGFSTMTHPVSIT